MTREFAPSLLLLLSGSLALKCPLLGQRRGRVTQQVLVKTTVGLGTYLYLQTTVADVLRVSVAGGALGQH